LRSCDDLDLLVHREDFSKAERLLVDLGFAPYAEADDYHRGFCHENVMVELHFGMASPRAFPIDLDGIWSRSQQGKFRAAPMQTMAHGDFLLFLCLHGLKHGFSRLIWITDISRALGITSHDIFKSLVSDTRQQDMELALLIGCEMVREVLPQQSRQKSKQSSKNRLKYLNGHDGSCSNYLRNVPERPTIPRFGACISRWNRTSGKGGCAD
jgi:hypothetical protein